jgi:threonine dehydrogenase-like Zn-dependent dehydrogenase
MTRRHLPFLIAEFFDQRGTLGSGQAPVKKCNEYLRDLIVNGRAKPSQIISHRIQIEPAPDAHEKFDRRIMATPKSYFAWQNRRQRSLSYSGSFLNEAGVVSPYDGLIDFS